MPIPKKIHQTHFTKDGLPGPVKENISRLMEMNPGWEYTFYDDADIVEFIRKHYSPEVLRLYNKISPEYGAARADLFRYLLIYKVGGAYFDIKSTANAPLDKIINGSDYVLTQSWEGYPQWHVLGAPDHPFLKAVIDLVLDNLENYTVAKFGVGRDGVFRTTGPTPYTSAIRPLAKEHPHQFYCRAEYASLQYTVMPQHSHESEVYTGRRHYSQLRSPVVLNANAANAPQINARISSHG